MKTCILDLIARDREQRFGDREGRIVEHRRAEQLQHALGVRSLAQFGCHCRNAAAVHLAADRAAAITPGSATCRRGRPRTGRPAAPCWPRYWRCLIRGFLARGASRLEAASCARSDIFVFLVVGADAEIRLAFQIHQRRHRAHALARHVRTAQHRRLVAGRAVGMFRTMTRSAGQLCPMTTGRRRRTPAGQAAPSPTAGRRVAAPGEPVADSRLGPVHRLVPAARRPSRAAASRNRPQDPACRQQRRVRRRSAREGRHAWRFNERRKTMAGWRRADHLLSWR